MVTQPDTILHLDRLEEAGAKAEKPDQAWCRSGSCLPMESEQKRRLIRQLADQSPILNTTITIARLTQRGYEPLLTHYYKVSPHYQGSPLFGY